MARRARSKDTCRHCGDVATTDADTWEPTGLCAAHSAEPVKAARKAHNAARRADRESVVVETPKVSEPLSGLANGPYRCVETYRGEVWINADGEPL